MSLVLYLLLWWVAGIGRDAPVWLDYAGARYGGQQPAGIVLWALLAAALLGLATATSRRRMRAG